MLLSVHGSDKKNSFQFSDIIVDLDKHSGHRGGHSCKIKYACEQYPRYNALGHLVVQNSAGPVYDCRIYCLFHIYFKKYLIW